MWSQAGRPGSSAATGQSLRWQLLLQTTITGFGTLHLYSACLSLERMCATKIGACCLQPIEFVAGGQVAGGEVKKITDTAGGLFAGAGGPKPPPALSSAVLGMRTGGKVWDAALASPTASGSWRVDHVMQPS